VGDLAAHNIHQLLEKYLGSWRATKASEINFPVLNQLSQQVVNYQINRDQVVLGYTGLSISRLDKNYASLLLFDQIFAGGVLGSMSSRLFQLREATGLFYTIGGSLLSHADEQPGMVFIKTIVSNDRLQEAEKAIQDAIKKAPTYIEAHELQEAKDAIINSLVDNFASNKNIASMFLFLNRFNLPDDYFDQRAVELAKINPEEVLAAAQQVLNLDKLVTIRAGRI
jgi:zinc protease